MSLPMKYFEATCCVIGCTSSPHTGQTFHLFPPYQERFNVPFKDESGEITFISRREAWMMLLNLNTINIRTRVCSKHFEDAEFQKTRRPSSSHTVINRNMLRTCSLPTLRLPKPMLSGERYFIVKELEKSKITSTTKSKKIILGVTAYVCCVPDCFHSSLTDKCKLFVIPNNPKTSKTAWDEFTCKMKQHIMKGSRVCSCHFFDDKLEEGPVFYPSDLMDALGLSLEQKKQYLCKIVPTPEGSWNVVRQSFYKNSLQLDENDESSRCSTPDLEMCSDDTVIPYRKRLLTKVETLKPNPEAFILNSGFKSYELFKTFLSVFDQDYIDVLTERTKVAFEDQMLLCLMKLKHNYSFSYLGKDFQIDSGDAKGIFERCSAVMENALCDGVIDVGKWEFRKTFWKEIPECSLVFFPVEVSLEKENPSATAEPMKHNIKKFKSLVSVTPAGLITYVGPFFPNYMPIEEIVNRSQLHSVAESGDIIFINETNAVQVKDIKDAQLILTPTSFSSDSEIQHYLLKHTNKISSCILEYSIVKFISAEVNHLSLRIWRIVCAVNNFNCYDPKELLSFYLSSQKIDEGDSTNDDQSHIFINLLPCYEYDQKFNKSEVMLEINA